MEDEQGRCRFLSEVFLYFTDSSAGRKEPLPSEIYIASSEDELRANLIILIEENMKKV